MYFGFVKFIYDGAILSFSVKTPSKNVRLFLFSFFIFIEGICFFISSNIFLFKILPPSFLIILLLNII